MHAFDDVRVPYPPSALRLDDKSDWIRQRLTIWHGIYGPLLRIGRPMALRQASAEQRGSRGATAGTGLAGCDARFEVPKNFLSTLKAGFLSSAQTGLETALLAGRPHRGMGSRQRLRMSITGSSSIRP